MCAQRTNTQAVISTHPCVIGLPLNKGQDFGFTPNKRPDYENPMFPVALMTDFPGVLSVFRCLVLFFVLFSMFIRTVRTNC
jgi:hypothetical protein